MQVEERLGGLRDNRRWVVRVRAVRQRLRASRYTLVVTRRRFAAPPDMARSLAPVLSKLTSSAARKAPQAKLTLCKADPDTRSCPTHCIRPRAAMHGQFSKGTATCGAPDAAARMQGLYAVPVRARR